MEDLGSWYSIAKSLSSKKESLQTELENAEQVINGIKQSLSESQRRLMEMLSEESLSIEDINLQERHLQLLGKLFIRKRSTLIRTAVNHCLSHFRKLLSEDLTHKDLVFDRRVARDIADLIISERGLPQTSSSSFKELLETVLNFLDRDPDSNRCSEAIIKKSCKRARNNEEQRVF